MSATPSPQAVVVTENWRLALPVLRREEVTLRPLRLSDAPSLFAILATEEVARFISPPPSSLDGFGRFIEWTIKQQRAGMQACFAVAVGAADAAVGIFQLRQLEPGFQTAEWGFAIGSHFWGTGVFDQGAKLMLAFAFDTVGVHRLEARACITNGRGNGALRKVGAVPEGVLRRSFLRYGSYLDQRLWTVLDEDWRHAKVIWGGTNLQLRIEN